MSQIDRHLFLNRCSLQAARQRRKRLAITALAGALLSSGAWTMLQASTLSGEPLPTRQSAHGVSNHLLSGVDAAGYATNALPYALLAGVPKKEIAPKLAARPSSEIADVHATEPTPPDTSAGSTEAARASIDHWAKAWRNKDVTGYLAAYDEGFQPANGMGRETWAKLRQQRIADKHVIQLELRDIRIQAETKDRVRVDFIQDYRADQFVERDTAKSMLLVLKKDGWRILTEESGPQALSRTPIADAR